MTSTVNRLGENSLIIQHTEKSLSSKSLRRPFVPQDKTVYPRKPRSIDFVVR